MKKYITLTKTDRNIIIGINLLVLIAAILLRNDTASPYYQKAPFIGLMSFYFLLGATPSYLVVLIKSVRERLAVFIVPTIIVLLPCILSPKFFLTLGYAAGVFIFILGMFIGYSYFKTQEGMKVAS